MDPPPSTPPPCIGTSCDCDGEWKPFFWANCIWDPFNVEPWVAFLIYCVAWILTVVAVRVLWFIVTDWGASFLPENSCLRGLCLTACFSLYRDNKIMCLKDDDDDDAGPGCCFCCWAWLWFSRTVVLWTVFSALAVVHILLIVLYGLCVGACFRTRPSRSLSSQSLSSPLTDSHPAVIVRASTQELAVNPMSPAPSNSTIDRAQPQSTHVAPSKENSVTAKLLAAEKAAADKGDYTTAARIRDSRNELAELIGRAKELKKLELAAKSAQKYEEAEAFKTELNSFISRADQAAADALVAAGVNGCVA